MASALAAMILADNGAEVVKVEPPRGAGERTAPGHRMWNRGKRSVVADLATGPGREQLRSLTALADVVISSLGADRLGLAADPRRIDCFITGMGPLDDGSGRPVHDALVSAAIGRMSEVDLLSGAVPGQDRRAPIFTAPPVLAYGAAQLAAQGVLAALLRRERTGRGDTVRTSLLQAWTVFMMRHPLVRGAAGPTDLPPTMQRGLELCFMTAECADGAYLQMCARQDEHFRSWLRALDLDHVLADARFAGLPLRIETMEAVDELERLLRAAMLTRPRAEWLDRFSGPFDVGGDPFLTTREFLDHPQLVENGRVVTLEDPEVGPVRQLGLLAELSSTPGLIRGPAPLLGADRLDAVLAQWTRDRNPADPIGLPGPVAPGEAPLHGITVLEAAHFVAGPLAGSLLAELGARVIKLEPLAGDPFRRTGSQAVKFLLGKESIALDLKHDMARTILDRLVARSDVFVHSFRPRVPARLGMDHARLAAVNPRLVYVYASAYGSRGPQRDRTAFHSTPTALSGAGIIQAGRGNPPVDDSFPDPGGALAVATAVLLGLHARSRTGVGQHVETTMLTSAGYVMSNDIVDYAGRPPVDVPDRGQHGAQPWYRLYECASGWLFLAAVRDRDREALATLVPDLEETTLAAAFAQRPAADWVRQLLEHGVPATVVHPGGSEQFLLEQGLLRPADHPVLGAFWRLPQKIDFAEAATCSGPAAALGEHSRALLSELGFEAAAIEEMVSAGVIGVCEPAQRVASPDEGARA